MATQWTAQGITSGAVLTAATLQTIGAAWETWTPVLTATTTNPNLGSTGTSTGRFARLQKIIIGNAFFVFGGSGISAGAGFFLFSLPVTAQSSGPGVGSISAIDVSTFASVANVATLDTNARIIGTGTGGGGLAATIQAASFPWAAGDQIKVDFLYEAA